VPMAQEKQPLAAEEEYFPELQDRQNDEEVAPAVARNRPAVQLEQLSDPVLAE